MTDKPITSRPRPHWIGVDPDQDETPRTPLSRPRVVRTALRLADQHGLPALTMRALATELQVSAMALYNYVRDKNELVDLMLDLMLGEVELTDTAGDWAAQLRAMLCSYHQVLSTHPGLARAYSHRICLGPHHLMVMERGISLLLQAGFCPTEAVDAFFALYIYTAGYHQMGHVDSLEYTALPPEEIPSITAVTAHLNSPREQGRFEFGLETLLAGLQGTRSRRRGVVATN